MVLRRKLKAMPDELSTQCANKQNLIKADIKKKYNLCTKDLTSTKVGHDFKQPVILKQQVLKLTVPEELRVLSVTLKETKNKTTYNDGFHWSYNENDKVDKASKIAGLRLQYIKPYAEQIKVNPPKPQRAPLSEYEDKYPIPQIYPPKSKVVDLRPAYICKIESNCKDQQPALKTESEGYSKHLDIYGTTAQLSYHPFNQREIDQYKDKPFESQTALSTRIKPVYDKAVFNKKYHEKILPKVSRPVPHSGMESEMKGNYRLPIDDMSTIRVKVPTQMPPITKQTKTEVLSIPAMYHTEYNHLGTNWHLSAVIDNKKIKS